MLHVCISISINMLKLIYGLINVDTSIDRPCICVSVWSVWRVVCVCVCVCMYVYNIKREREMLAASLGF